MGRTSWTDVPTTLRQRVAWVLGGPVVTAESQASGWSPGSADRVTTAGGRRAFVKTVSRSRNEDALELHRREAAVMAQLPTTVQAPQLLDSLHTTVDGDDWVALVLDDVAGQHPGRHLDGSDTAAVLDALHTLPPATGGLATLPRIAEDLRGEFGAWDRMLADDADAARVAEVVPPHVLDAGTAIARAASGAAALVWVVDWPWASVGAHWLDPLTYLLDTLVRGEDADVERHLATHPVFAEVPADTIDAVLAGLAGLFFEHALQPAPPNMPTIRDFQRREGVAAAEWLLRRWAE
ncbi:hypothetical protein N8D74_04195 [Curtobacterium flaccumfaciens]|uniref:Aminoglycoside phosphotransferase family protein n=1 Tax=Curtobacterium poinsettiae TaxID=159612 RepID=A0A9Q9T3J8_9MICO|nr:hypothetical protein [Curtobacterium flaccumfaciens]UXN26090.1 hypothetical protein N8D74_04195 [Curtobacterium flaccumfaciens]UYC80932.1 hypothetical protein OE229_00275 [Curtobacterium flaccumfaciens pv. poinsettiae]